MSNDRSQVRIGAGVAIRRGLAAPSKSIWQPSTIRHGERASDVIPKFVSPSDPAAQWTGAHKGPAFFAYPDNYLIDVKFGVIVDVEASRSTTVQRLKP
jgi:hypothetical protein